MERTRLLQLLFLNDNQEFIRKACELVKYLHAKHNITDQDIHLLWDARTHKHETSVKEIYALIADLPLYETQHARKLELFAKVATLPEASWDEDYIKMIKDFSENSYGLEVREKLADSFGFEMVYRYTLRHQTDFALTLMTSLLQKLEKSAVFLAFQQRCF